MTKLYLVWNEAKTECVGFKDHAQAVYALKAFWAHHKVIQPSEIADKWLETYDNEECTITEIEV